MIRRSPHAAKYPMRQAPPRRRCPRRRASALGPKRNQLRLEVLGRVVHHRNTMLSTLLGKGEAIDLGELCRSSGGKLSGLEHEDRRIQLDSPCQLGGSMVQQELI